MKGHNAYIAPGLIRQLTGVGLTYISAGVGLIVLALVPLIYLVLFALDKRSFDELYRK